MTRKKMIRTNKLICENLCNLWQFFFLLFFLSLKSFSQDTAAVAPKLPPAYVTFIREDNVAAFNTEKHEVIDSSLSKYYHFDKFLYNITQEKNIFDEKENEPAGNSVVNYSDDITSPYKFSSHTIRYYKLNRRFTEVSYVSGRKKEKLANIAYSQNLTKGWNVGLDFRRSGAQGFFRRQIYYQSSFDVFTHYESPNDRYNLFAYYLRNRLEQEENGGVKQFNPNENTVAEPTYLSAAQNRQTDKDFLLRQSFQLNNPKRDSISAAQTKFIIGHTVRYETKGRTYAETSIDSFYQHNYFDSTSTNDSTWYQRWNNEMFFSSQFYDSTGFAKYTAAAGHEYLLYKYGNPDLIFLRGQKENVYLRGDLSFGARDKSVWSGGILYVVAGDYKKDYDAYFNYHKLLFKDTWKFFVSGNSKLKHADIDKQRTFSNHFIWFNNFSPVSSGMAEAGIATTNKSFLVSFALRTEKNFIEYNSLSTPVQLDGTEKIYSATLQKNFVWRSWHFDNKIIWQKAGDENIIHLPQLMTGHSLYLERYFFKKKLFARLGTDVHYVSSYYADRYMPALQEFYLQYTQKTGGYALADVYINFRVKACLFFIKAENIFSGLSNKAYFYRPDYPLTPRVIRFGLMLRFFD